MGPPLHLPCISAASPLHLRCIYAASPQVASYLEHQGRKFVEHRRFDANSYAETAADL
jgi:homoserine acetyltransferase